MAELEPLGILGLEGVHYYVRDLERSERFYVDRMDFTEIAESGPSLSEGGRQRSRVFRAGEYVVVCSSPTGEGGRADRYLKKHPDGVGTIAFRVADAQRAFTLWTDAVRLRSMTSKYSVTTAKEWYDIF